MTVHRFTDYAYEQTDIEEEVLEFFEDRGWPEEDAKQYFENHNPLYEVAVDFEYDTETDKLKVLEARVDGTTLRPIA